MNPVATQQVALDNSLVAPEKRLKIEKCNARIAFSKLQREETYQVTLDALRLSPCYPAFLITAKVPEIYMHQFWTPIKYVLEFSTKTLLHHLQKKNWLHSFRNLAILASVIRYLQFILIKCTSLGEYLLQSSIGAFLGKQHDLIDSGNHEIKSCEYGSLIPDDMINQDIKDSKAYKTYYDFAIGKVPPRKARRYKKVASPSRKLSLIKEAEPVKKAKRVQRLTRSLLTAANSRCCPQERHMWVCISKKGKHLLVRKFKKIASPSRKLSLVKEAKPVKKAKRVKRPAKKSATTPTVGVVIKDTPGVSISKKKAPAKGDRVKGIELLSDAALLEAAQVPNEFEDKTTGTYEGTSTKPGVPNVPSYESDIDNELWGDSENESDDVNDDDNDNDNAKDDDNGNEDDDGNDAHDSERTNSDDDDENPSFTLKDYDEEEHDEEYKSDDEYENVYEEEDDDLYKDVDMRSLRVEHEKEREGNAEMTDADQNVSQEKSYEQVIEDAHVTLTSSQKTESLRQSSSVSSDFASKFLILDNVPPVVDEVASMMNVKNHQEESSTQAPSLFIVPETVILEISTAHATTAPPTISMITPLPQLMTPSPAPTTVLTTSSIPALPDFSSLFGFNQRVSTLETELSQIKQADHSTQLLESEFEKKAQEERKLYIDVVEKSVKDIVKDEVKSLLPQILPKEVSELRMSLENVILAKSSSQPKSTYEAAVSLTEFELKKILFDKIEKNFINSSNLSSTYDMQAVALTEFELKATISFLYKIEKSNSYQASSKHRRTLCATVAQIFTNPKQRDSLLVITWRNVIIPKEDTA
ncbi:hypothetical protein Tco_0644288 [Tanacetum coccineum]